MKYRKLTLLASLLLTFAMIAVVIAFEQFSKGGYFSTDHYFAFVVSIVIIFSVNFLVLERFFIHYGKHQIEKISTQLPPEFSGESADLSFSKIGEKMSELSQKNASEIDTMKEMEHYRKEYLGNVSHELKTPLFSIQGYVETLLDGGVDDLEIRDKYLQRIDSSVERLLSIVQDLDMINKYESGEIKLQISKFDINSLIREVIELLEIEAERKKATVQLHAYQPQIFVKADKQKISQVLINLISNAIYYSNREDALITIRLSSFRNTVLVEVHDNGMGIKPELLPRIFERFYRVESSRSRREGGSGLGLAIVKHILEAHLSKISVKSIYLEGSTFSFMLDKAD